MPKTSSCSDRFRQVKTTLLAVLLGSLLFAINAWAAPAEQLTGFYAREGNNASPAATSRNNIYIKFYPDRWVGMLFIPYPYAAEVQASAISGVFETARQRTTSAALMRNKFGLLDEAATIQIERYGYLQDRIVFECGGMSPCTIKLYDGYLELIKPGVINEHIVKYDHVMNP